MAILLIRNLFFFFTSFRRSLILASFIFIPVIVSAKPSRGAEGIINSVSFANVPHGATVVIDSFDDSEDSLKILDVFRSAIKSAGYAPSETGTLLMSFDIRNNIGSFSTRGRRYILSLETTGGQLGGGQDSRAKVNVFNSNTGGLLNRGRGMTTITTPSTYEIELTIENRNSGKTLWQGWVSAKLKNKVGLEYIRPMIPKIIQTIGKTVRQEQFPLY